MHIAMIGRDLPRSKVSTGVSGQMHLLAETLCCSGHQVTVYALNPPPNAVGYSYRPIPIPATMRKHRRAVMYMLPWWISHIHLNDFDVVHAHGEDQLIRTRRPLVRTFHGAERAEAQYSRTIRHRLYHLSMVPLEWISEQRATAVVAVSQSAQRYFKRRVTVIPCGYDPAVFHPAGQKSRQPSILFVGDLGTRKRAELLLEAFSTVVRKAIPETELWMVTSDTVSAPGVRSLGRVTTENLADLYRRAWVYCMPSTYEGFGVPYLEAMASGTPVVATANGGAEEVLADGRAGCIAPDEKIGAELVRLLTNDAARLNLTASGLARAREYEMSKIASKYLALYEALVSENPLVAP